MSTKDLYALAVENGMTDEEFVKEVRECFATYISLILDGVWSMVWNTDTNSILSITP